MSAYIADRGALAKALFNAMVAAGFIAVCSEHAERLADALIASGVVIAADSLADDKALIADTAYALAEGEATYAASTVRHVLRALAAALTERTR